MRYVRTNGPKWAELFGGVLPRDQTAAVKWYGDQLRMAGAITGRLGRHGQRSYTYDFTNVHQWSGHFRAKVVDQYQKQRENKEWNKTIKELRGQPT
jgi:hypothetical protein